MRYQIVSDSSSNIFHVEGANYTTVPMKVVGAKEYVDTPELDLQGMVDDLKKYKSWNSLGHPLSWDDVYKLNLAQFYLAFEAYYKRIKKFFKDFHHIDLDYKKINYKELLYNEDGLEFEKRLQKHIKKCRTSLMNLIQLGNVYDTILLTEQSCIYHELQSYAFDDDEFVVFEFVGGCEKCTEEYVDGEIYRHDECEEGSGPPYHPACQCFFIDFIAEDDELRDLFPEYDYEGEK